MLYFWSWRNLDNVGGLWNFGNVGNLWCCWMNFGLDFGGMDIVKNLCCRHVWIYSWCMWEILLACVKFISWTWLKFVGPENFCGYGINLWAWNFSYTRIYWCMGRNLWEFLYGYFGHVGVFCAWLWKNLVVVYGHVKNFDCGEILLGHWFFVMGHWLFFLGIFWIRDFGHGNFLDMWKL